MGSCLHNNMSEKLIQRRREKIEHIESEIRQHEASLEKMRERIARELDDVKKSSADDAIKTNFSNTLEEYAQLQAKYSEALRKMKNFEIQIENFARDMHDQEEYPQNITRH